MSEQHNYGASQGGYQGGGYPNQPPPPSGYGSPAQQGNGLAVTGMVLGIIALVLFWFPIVNFILAILAIVFGGIGVARANHGASGKGMAIAGLVLGIVTIVLYVVIIAIIVNN